MLGVISISHPEHGMEVTLFWIANFARKRKFYGKEDGNEVTLTFEKSEMVIVMEVEFYRMWIRLRHDMDRLEWES